MAAGGGRGAAAAGAAPCAAGIGWAGRWGGWGLRCAASGTAAGWTECRGVPAMTGRASTDAPVCTVAGCDAPVPFAFTAALRLLSTGRSLLVSAGAAALPCRVPRFRFVCLSTWVRNSRSKAFSLPHTSLLHARLHNSVADSCCNSCLTSSTGWSVSFYSHSVRAAPLEFRVPLGVFQRLLLPQRPHVQVFF